MNSLKQSIDLDQDGITKIKRSRPASVFSRNIGQKTAGSILIRKNSWKDQYLF